MNARQIIPVLVGAILVVASLWRLEHRPVTQIAAGIAAYQEGDFGQSMILFQAAAEKHASVQLQKNIALAALQSGDFESASLAAAMVANLGKGDDLAWHDFLLGNLAWKRSLLAEIEAHGPVPPAGALERAIAQAEVAQEAWQAALDAQGSWPEAQRNLQRVKDRLHILTQELASSASADTPASEKMPAPSDANTPSLSDTKQLQIMQQLERLDQQNVKQEAARKPKSSGGWEW